MKLQDTCKEEGKERERDNPLEGSSLMAKTRVRSTERSK